MNLRASTEDAGSTIREGAWAFQERVLWRGSDRARAVLKRARTAGKPLQRLVQTRLTWPLSDAYHARSARTQAALAASGVALVLAAGAAGAISAADDASTHPRLAPLAPVTAATPASDTLVLQGVTPQFESGDAPAPPPPPAEKPTEKPAQVAWEFAQAFVAYEVGLSDKATTSTFGTTATKQLAKALDSDPPRLPASGKVPKARVLNVVLGDGGKQQVTASVSLVRLRSLSELRLTLTRTGSQWRVAQVLG